MTAFVTAMRWDIVVQARNGFYWASAFVVLVVGSLLLSVPETARADAAAWVPAILAVNLQITTFFFVAGLMLLERDEGTLAALAVSPLSPGGYLAARTITLTTLAAAETVAVVWVAFGAGGSWLLILAGTAALGVIYTGFGTAVAARYPSVNAMLLPASVFVTLLLLPLLPHFGLAPRAPFLLHPIEPALVLLRAAYGGADTAEVAFGAIASAIWSAVAFVWGRKRVERVMRDTRAGGGR
jgi:fluoroquinolone transport system permease protein